MYKYFKDSELQCSHCGEVHMDEEFMRKIEALRESLGFPFVVSSAYRCKEQPLEATKKTTGAHVQGRAMDIRASGEKALRLVTGATTAGFTGVGLKQKGNGRFVHLDDLDSPSRPTIWSY